MKQEYADEPAKRVLQLHGMDEALQQQLQQAATSSLNFEERLAQLVDAQWLWRENRTTATRLRQARLKQPASLEDVNYRHPRHQDEIRGVLALELHPPR